MKIFRYFLGLKCPESKQKFSEIIALVEKWSKIIEFLSKKVTPACGILSRAIPSYCLYFFTDSGNEAFVLPVPMW